MTYFQQTIYNPIQVIFTKRYPNTSNNICLSAFSILINQFIMLFYIGLNLNIVLVTTQNTNQIDIVLWVTMNWGVRKFHVASN